MQQDGRVPEREARSSVQFDSTLELRFLRPVQLNYTLDDETREYTPDIAVQLLDGRVFIIEAKPIERLGEFTNLKKWSALASWCADAGVGFWVGSPERSLTEHYRVEPDPEKHELIAAEVDAGPVTGDDYDALVRLAGYEQLGLASTQMVLEWRSYSGSIRHSTALDRAEVARFWKLFASWSDGSCAKRARPS